MSIGGHLPIIFYEVAFIIAFAFVPMVAFRGDIENYIFGLTAMYFCQRIVRQRRKTQLPAEGRAVFISGCDSGFGNLEAAKLDELGYKVFAGCLNPEGDSAQKLKGRCSDRLLLVGLDVTSEESVKNAGKYVRENLNDCQLWALINTVGIYGHGDIELSQLGTYERLMDVNCFGAIRLTKELLPLLRQSKGRVVLVSSVMAMFTWPCASAYSASKMALKCFGDCLRMEMKKFGVTVSMVEPPMFSWKTDEDGVKNVSRYYKDANTAWDAVSDDVRPVYSKAYLSDQIDAVVKLRQSYGGKNPDSVIDALTEAVTGSSPKCRYTIQGGPFPIDLMAVYGAVHRFLPESISDWILCKVTGHSDQSLIELSAGMTKNGNGTKQE